MVQNILKTFEELYVIPITVEMLKVMHVACSFRQLHYSVLSVSKRLSVAFLYDITLIIKEITEVRKTLKHD